MIAESLAKVQLELSQALELANRSPEEADLLVVSKTFPAEIVAEAIAAGQLSLGENRVQEALEKQSQLPSHIQWHLIGPLQRNKVRKVVGKFACLQAIDSLKLAHAINRVAAEEELKQKIFLQVKVGGEATKSGFEPELLKAQIEELAGLENLSIGGLMTIPPPVSQPEDARPYFAAVRELRDELSSQCGLALRELSMGMSSDFQAAIAEGSTLVRVGSAIFGKRANPVLSNEP